MEATGEIANRFTLKRELVKRTSCSVFIAGDKSLEGLEVAVKLFVEGPGESQTLKQQFDEAVQRLRTASHPVLVPVIAGGVHEGRFFLALEYIKGESLREMLKLHDGPLDLKLAVGIIALLAEGLGELHSHGIVHGHIDSRAVLFREDEPRLAGYCPDVIDLIQRSSTTAGRMLSEPAYMAPEQVSGAAQLSPQTDIYAISVLLFEMVTGARPFNGTNPMQTAMLHVTQAVPSPRKVNPTVPPLLDAAIQKGLAKDPKDRFQHCRDLIEAIQHGVDGGAAEKVVMGGEASFGTETVQIALTPEEIKKLLNPPKSPMTTASPQPASSLQSVSVDQTVIGMAAVKLPQERVAGGGAHTALAPPAVASTKLEVAQTLMGAKALDPFTASVMILSGAKRGERVILEKAQTMLGSDPACDITVAEKKLPSRYALIIRRGEGYTITPLSSTPVRLNDSTVEPEREQELKRGDVITAGEVQIRFIAPGEVFTLRENVADRVVDRPKSKVPAVLAGALAVGLVVLVGAGYLYKEQSDAARQAQQQAKATQEAEREAMIKRLIREGDEFYKAGALTLPVGANAEERFRQVLELKPDYAYAKSRLAEIDSRLKNLSEERLRQEQLAQRIQQGLGDGEQYFQARALIAPPGKNAREAYEQVLKLDPKNEKALQRIQEINSVLTDQLNRVKDTLAQAKAHMNEGRFAQPPGQNAYEVLQQVLEVDPNNREARDMIYDMAAQSLFQGDRAKARAQSIPMKQAYLTAKVLGVDPQLIKDRLKGAELMKKAKSSVIIVDQNADENEEKKSAPASAQGAFLDGSELERRIAQLTLGEEEGGGAKERMFIDLKKE